MSKSNVPSFLALGCVGAMAFASTAQAQSQQQQGQEGGRRLGGMTVTDTAVEEPSVRVERAASPKYTAPLAETPQTITVISRQNIDQQNLLTLREVLSTVPGVTFAAGEGGNGYGDNILLMGVDARNDVTINGVRSSSNVSRNETYNIEQVEVTVGANSVYNGGGNVAGSINLVTKRPLANDMLTVQGGVGTDNYFRGTVDINRRLTDIIAVRLNAVYHQNDVPGRDVEYYDRWGVAPSIIFGVDGPTSLTLQYEHLTDHSLPQYGIRYYPNLGGIVQGFNRSGYYGLANVDRQNSIQNSVQAIVDHKFSDDLRFRNLTRYENIGQDTITTQPVGNFCLADSSADGWSPGTPTSGECANISGTTTKIPVGYYQPSQASRGTIRLFRNETMYNQADLSGSVRTGGIKHDFVLGASYQWERFVQTAGGTATTAPAAGWPLINIANPSQVIPGPTIAGASYGSNVFNGPITFTLGTRSFGKQEVFAGYLFDTAKITDWLQLNGGIRFEHVKGQNYTITNAGVVSAPTVISQDLFSYRVGLLFKPIPEVSLYIAHGTSKRPSQAAVSSGCTATSTTGGNNCTLKPETTRNYEIGVKAELFDRGLLLSASAFRNDRDTIRVQSNDPTLSDQVLDGKERSQGFTLGAVGNVTPQWSITANYMYIDAYTRQSVSDFCLRNPGQGTCTNTPAVPDPLKNSPSANVPEHSGNIFTTYTFPFGLQIGYGINYQGSFAMNRFTLADPAAALYRVPSYMTHRLMVSYKINDALRAQVNVQNLWDEEYVTTVRTSTGNSWATPGPTRQAVFSLTGTF